MIALRKIIVWFGVVMGLFSCVDEIPVELNDTERFIVIDGRITNGSNTQQVRVMRSPDLKENSLGLPDMLSGAVVSIMSDTGEECFFSESEPGLYQVEMTGEVGRAYYIEINIDGKTYRSRLEKLLPVVEIENVAIRSASENVVNSAGNITTNNLVKVFSSLTVPNNSENVYFKWEINGEYKFTDAALFPNVCFIPVNLNANNIAVFGEPSSQGKSLVDFEILSKVVNSNFSSTYCFHIEQYSITKNAYDFWSKTNLLINREGGLFETPPGRISGNLYNINDESEYVFGFFSASAVTKVIECVAAYEIEGAYEQNCESSTIFFTNQDPNCLCSQISNSNSVRPSYWP